MLTDLRQPTVKEFFHVIWHDLGARLSGSLSVPFTFLAVFTSNSRTRPIYGSLAVIGILLTIYQVWSKERQSALIIQNELKNEIEKQGRPQVAVELKTDAWGTLHFCLMNYTDSPAVNLRADDIRCGNQSLRLDLPPLVSSGFSPNIQVYRPDEVGQARNWIGIACIQIRQEGGNVSEMMLAALRYTDQEVRHEWVTCCRFYYDFSMKKFVIEKQWIERYKPRREEDSQRPILTSR
jgi:hypothetical protein